MKKYLKFLLAFLLVSFFAFSFSSEALAEDYRENLPVSAIAETGSKDGYWRKDSRGYWFQFEDGSYARNVVGYIDGVAYAFSNDGYMITGWGKVLGDWYYCNSKGVVQFGWEKVGGKWYYFDSTYGNMYHSGAYVINNQTYVFNTDGSMMTGWYKEDNTWYYIGNDGLICRGWILDGGKWYYLDPQNGALYQDGWYTIDEVVYLINKDGSAYTGWFSQPEGWMYFKDGIGYNGWIPDGGKWYYIDNGWMICNCVNYEIDGTYYGFDKNGVMVIGWHQSLFYYEDGTSDVDWFYYNQNGSSAQGWKKINGIWYFFEDGWMVDDGVYFITKNNTLSLELNAGTAYSFKSDGTYAKSCWVYDEYFENWFYFGSDGTGYNGWLKSGNNWYYLLNGWMCYNGVYQTGTNQYSQFDANGIWLGYALIEE